MVRSILLHNILFALVLLHGVLEFLTEVSLASLTIWCYGVIN